jgi:hypothetical protein
MSLLSSFGSPAYSDFSVVDESGDGIALHKVVLAQRNDYFNRYLASEIGGEKHSLRVERVADVLPLLEYFYSDSIELLESRLEVLSWEKKVVVFEYIEHWLIEELRRWRAEYILQRLEVLSHSESPLRSPPTPTSGPPENPHLERPSPQVKVTMTGKSNLPAKEERSPNQTNHNKISALESHSKTIKVQDVPFDVYKSPLVQFDEWCAQGWFNHISDWPKFLEKYYEDSVPPGLLETDFFHSLDFDVKADACLEHQRTDVLAKVLNENMASGVVWIYDHLEEVRYLPLLPEEDLATIAFMEEGSYIFKEDEFELDEEVAWEFYEIESLVPFRAVKMLHCFRVDQVGSKDITLTLSSTPEEELSVGITTEGLYLVKILYDCLRVGDLIRFSHEEPRQVVEILKPEGDLEGVEVAYRKLKYWIRLDGPVKLQKGDNVFKIIT